MKLSLNWRTALVAALTGALLLPGCLLDPNARKQKYFQSGQRYFEQGKYQEAALEFIDAIQTDPEYADAHLQLAETYLRLQQRDRAYQELTRAVELRPLDFRARIELTNLLIQVRNFPQAHEQTDILLKQRPDDPGIHSMASNLLAAQGKFPDAIAELQKSIALAPGRWEPYLNLAILQNRISDLPDAEASFKKVVELNPKADPARLMLGNFYQSQKRFDEAEKQYREVLAIDSNTIAPRKALAGLYLAEGKKTEAENILQQAKRDLPQSPDAYLALSDFYFTTGNLDKSVTEYGELFQIRSHDAQVKEKYVQLLIQASRYEMAWKLNEEILKSNPKDDNALVHRSQLQIMSGDVNDAAQTLQMVVNSSPNNMQAHFALGIALQQRGNLESAERQWREALRLNPDFLDAERSLANAAMIEGDMNALEDAANQMIRLQPGVPEGYALRAVANINRARYAEAEQDVRKAIGVAPDSSFGYVQLGNLRFAQKRYRDAVKPYQDALDRNASSKDALRGLVNAYVAQHQVDQAVSRVKEQIGKEPNNSGFYSLLGAVLFRSKKDLNGAESALEKSTALDSHNYDALFQLCQVRAAKGDTDQAIATAMQSLNNNPRQLNVNILLGALYESKSDWKKAEDAYQNALALNSQNPEAANDLARVLIQAGGSLDSALTLAQTARRGMPNSPIAVDTMGWIYYKQGTYPLAISNLMQALQLQAKIGLPDDPDIHYHLGLAYEKTGQPALARQQFEQVLKIAPHYRDAADVQSALVRLKS